MAIRSSKSKKTDSSSADPSESDIKDIPTLIADTVKSGIEPVKKELNEYKAKFIEILAILTALFTFISVDVQVFKSEISSLAVAGIVLIMLGALLLFVVVLNMINNTENTHNKKNTSVLLISLVLLVAGTTIAIFGRSDSKALNSKYASKENFENLEKKINEDKALSEFKKCLKSGGWNKCLE